MHARLPSFLPSFLRSLAAGLIVLFLLPATVRAQTPCPKCPAGGTTWYVDNSSLAPTPDGLSWATAFRTLQAAISAASDGDCIWVAAGRYFGGFSIGKSISLYGGFAGGEACLSGREGLFVGTRLSGEQGNIAIPSDNYSRVITIEGPFPFGSAPHVVIDGFNIRDAFNDDFGAPSFPGGGIYCVSAGSLLVRNCIIRNNAAGYGAGMYVSTTPFDMAECRVVQNHAEFRGGGGYLSQVFTSLGFGGSQIHNTEISSNTAGDYETPSKGGGLYLEATAQNLQLANCLMVGNRACNGGALYLSSAPSVSNVDILSATMSLNGPVPGSSQGSGAVMYLESGSTANATSSVFWNNDASVSDITAVPPNDVFLDHTTPDLNSFYSCTPMPDCANDGACTNWDCDPLFKSGYHLTCGSPAQDSGIAALPPDVFDLDSDGDLLEPIPVDLDGNPRVQGGIDRGAYEECVP